MITEKSPLHGLPYIDRPQTTWMQGAAFYLQRNWMWTTVLARFVVVTVSITVFALVMKYSGGAPSQLKVLGLILFALPFVQAFLLASTFLESGVARPWMIRAALASTNEEERAFLYERILQLTTSEWRDDSLSRGELFGLFKQARKSFGTQVRWKREKLGAAREAQIKELYAIDGSESDSS